MVNKLLTANDIDTNQKSIDKKILVAIEEFVKSRLKKQIKEIKDKNKIEGIDNQITKDEIEKIKLDLFNDEETEKFREIQKENIQIISDNYYILRKTINNLNDLNEFSAEIERNNIQTIDKFNLYHEVLNKSLNVNDLFNKIKEIRLTNIDNYINSYKNKILSFKEDSLTLLLKMRELYNTDKKTDDIYLYDKFGLENNIQMSNKLADICFKDYINNDNTNIINEFSKNNKNPLERLIKSEIVNNKFLGILLLSGLSTERTSFITNNSITCLKTSYVTDFNNEYIYTTRTLGELLYEITNSDYQFVDKAAKQQIYLTYDGSRPSSEEYYKWSGLQVFDIDLKYWDGSIDLLKKKMFEYLSDFHWFLWIVKSASGLGLHIYTKVAPPHHVYTTPADNEYISKYWYNVNYCHKVSIIYDIIYRLNADSKININFPKSYFNEDSNNFELTNKVSIDGEGKLVGIDNTVGRITSGIRLTYDAKPLINYSFLDLHVGLGLSQTLDGFTYKNSINNILLRKSNFNNALIKKINETLAIQELIEIKKDDVIDWSKHITVGNDISNIFALPRNSINYTVRYNVVNTLASLFGKDGLPIAHTILNSNECKNVGEINAFYSCALSNLKTPSKLGLDILKKQGIIKSIEPEIKKTIEDKYKEYIKKLIENSLDNKLIKQKIELSEYEYLSDKEEILLNPSKGGITNNKINIIFSPPGSGKTEWIKKLARDGKRILLVLPYISVIKNKVETDAGLMKMFDCYYGTKDIRKLEYGINAVTTFDKFSKSNYDKISKIFDYVFIDESHLLFTSAYRIEATSNVVRKIKELFFISSNDPFAAKLCLLTGTETGESYFFNKVSNIIRVNKSSLNKTMEFLICDDILDSLTRLANHATTLLNEGHKLLIPTNKGEIYSEKIIGMIEYLIGRQIKYGYYKRSNTEQEICRLINDNNTVGDYEIIFCSNYLSVGVDINDKIKFASIYLGNFSGYEIEQFNARIRKTGIRSVYCIQTQKNSGETSDILLEEPNLLLHITDEDKNNFLDDKQIASAKQEFLAQYDPVLHKIVTPGFSYFNGKIRFNLEEYELISFETKYNECMQHPIKVARELSKYGYVITVNTDYEGLTPVEQENLRKIGLDAAKDEKIRKHSLLVGTFIELVSKNNYINDHGLEFTDVIGWIGKNPDLVFENREQEEYLKIEFDIFATPLKVEAKSKEALDFMYKPAKYLISKYSLTKTLDILNLYVDETGLLKQKSFKRAINLLRLVDSSDANELAAPLSDILERIYEFVDKFETTKDFKISYNTFKATMDEWTNSYIDMLGIKINTTYGYEKLRDSLNEMLSDIATKSTTKAGIRFSYNRLPDQDSSGVLNRRSVDSMIEKMFQITSELIQTDKTKNPRDKHIILVEQSF